MDFRYIHIMVPFFKFCNRNPEEDICKVGAAPTQKSTRFTQNRNMLAAKQVAPRLPSIKEVQGLGFRVEGLGSRI